MAGKKYKSQSGKECKSNGMESLLDLWVLTVQLPRAVGWLKPASEVSLRLAPAEALGLVGESANGSGAQG